MDQFATEFNVIRDAGGMPVIRVRNGIVYACSETELCLWVIMPQPYIFFADLHAAFPGLQMVTPLKSEFEAAYEPVDDADAVRFLDAVGAERRGMPADLGHYGSALLVWPDNSDPSASSNHESNGENAI